jgi:hypothetical protein
MSEKIVRVGRIEFQMQKYREGHIKDINCLHSLTNAM